MRIRIPIIPGITDTKENLEGIGALLSTMNNIQRIDLLPYHNTASEKYRRLTRINKLADLQPPTSEEMNEHTALLEQFGIPVHIGG